MADLNYVSPLTSDLTDYYTKTEVDELQQGDENRFATQAQITAGDNEVKGWVASQGYLTQHQSLANYATKEYVDEAIEDIEVSGGMKIRVVNVLPAEGEEGIFYLVYESNDEEENRYAEYIWSDTLNGYEMLGYGTGEGVMPDLTNYATKSYVDTAVGAIVVPDVSDFIDAEEAASIAADEVEYKMNTLSTVAVSGDYDDLSNKPTIPSLTGYATTTYVNDEIATHLSPYSSGADISQEIIGVRDSIPDVSDFITEEDLPDITGMATQIWVQNQGYLTQHQDISGKANAADLAAVATTGSYNDLSNKPTIPSTSGLASETYVDNAIAAIDIPTKVSDLDNDMNFIDEGMAKASAIDEINNNVSAAGLSGSYNDLDDKPTIPSITGLATETYVDTAVAGISVPANTSDLTNDSGFITSADLPDTSGFVESSDLATVATTGDYDDLTNKPTIPVLPTLATVATSGSYNDLSDKPTIPTGGIEGTAEGMFAFIYPDLLDNSVRKCHVINSNTTQDELIELIKSGYWVRIMNQTIQNNIPIGSFGNYNRVFIYTCNVSTGVITSQYYQSGTLAFPGYGWVVRVLPNAFLYIPCSSSSTIDTEAIPALKKMRDNYLLSYSNTTSGLSATTFQAAIDELAQASGGGASTAAQLSYDNTNTWNDGTDTDTVQEAIDALYADVDGLDIPNAVGWSYNSNTKTLTLIGVEEDIM